MLKTLFLSLWVIAQPTHVSFMGLECFPEKEIIKIYLKLNYSDFIYDYRFTINDDQNFDPSGEIDTAKILVSRYLANRIQIFADDKKLKGQLTNIESSNGELNIDLLYNYNKKAKHFKVKNTILAGLNKKQYALLIFKYNDFEEEAKLTPEKTEQTFIVK
jgi:hypothetical protein